MAHETDLRRRPDPAPGAAPPPARPAGGGILLLRDCWSGIAEVRIPLAALDPRRGVVLVAAGPPGMLSAVEGALRQRLSQARFGAVFPGHLPVVVLPAEAWDREPGTATSLDARLEGAFAGRPHLSLPPGGAWVPSVARLLQSPPAPQHPQGRARGRRRIARLRWLAGGLGLGLLLIGGIAGLSDRSGVVLSDAPRPDVALSGGFASGWPGRPVSQASGSAEGERTAVRPSDRDAAPPPGSRPERQAAMGSPVGAGRPDAAPRPREAQAGADKDRTSTGGPAVRPGTDAPVGMAGAETEAGAAAERREAEVRAAAERREAERAAAERREAEAHAAAERREAERAARRAAAIDAALRAEAVRKREQEETDALRRDEAEAARRRQQEAAEAALRARQDAEAALRARQQQRCQSILQLLRAGGYPADADLAFFDHRCMPG